MHITDIQKREIIYSKLISLINIGEKNLEIYSNISFQSIFNKSTKLNLKGKNKNLILILG